MSPGSTVMPPTSTTSPDREPACSLTEAIRLPSRVTSWRPGSIARPSNTRAFVSVTIGPPLPGRRARRASIIVARSNRRTLPVGVCGTSSCVMSTMRRGILKLDRRSRSAARRPSSVGSAPGAGITAATTSSPTSGSGSPATNDSATSGSAFNAASTSRRETLAELVLIMSPVRPTNHRYPSASMRTRSLVG